MSLRMAQKYNEEWTTNIMFALFAVWSFMNDTVGLRFSLFQVFLFGVLGTSVKLGACIVYEVINCNTFCI